MPNTSSSPSNTSAFIGRLPNEILSEIFLCVHDLVAIQPDSDEPFKGAPECVFLSHVCHHWRVVVIACQRLWALLPRHNIEWTRACVARAHSTPVNLRFDIWIPDPRLRIPRRLAFPLISRAETLTLYIELDRYNEARRDATEVLQGLAAHAAPLLEELKITLDQNFTLEEYRPTSISSLFKGETPHKLRLVDLEGCLLHHPRSIFSSSVTDIKLDDSCIWSDVDDMITFFQSVPQLVSFTFNYHSNDTHGFPTAPSTFHPLRCVSLPNLREFTVEASFDAAIRMFSYLTFPSKALLGILPTNSDLSARFTEHELEDLVNVAASVTRAHFADSVKQGRYCKSVEVSPARISGPHCYLGIPEDLLDMPQLRAATAAMYLAAPFFAKTKKLTIEGDMEGFLMHDLACCTNVRQLHLQGVAPVLFEAALREGQLSADELFPECIEVSIHGFNFLKWPGMSVHGCPVPEALEARLLEMLDEWRADAEKPLGIVFKNCTMGTYTEAAFKSIFGANHVSVL